MLIVRNNRSLDSLDRVFDQLTQSLFAPTARPRAAAAPAPHVQADWHEGSLVLTVDLPGVPRDAVSVEVAERGLTIAVAHSTERGEVRWSRSLQLGGSLDAEAVNARYADGRLTVTVPPAATPEPRRITIEGPADEASGSEVVAPPAIETSAEG